MHEGRRLMQPTPGSLLCDAQLWQRLLLRGFQVVAEVQVLLLCRWRKTPRKLHGTKSAKQYLRH